MLESDKQALRALLLSICDRSCQGASGVLDSRGILADVVGETQLILAEVAYTLNEKRTCCRLPREILGKCLSYLAFAVRIRASRTSRAWRAAVLAIAPLWADIRDNGASELSVPALELALARAAAVPLSLDLSCKLTGDKLNLVRRAMHRVAHLELPYDADATCLEQPAPLLLTLRLMADTQLTTSFLSGRSSRLATLQAEKLRFATSCPALTTLTTLIVGRCEWVALREIFTMCPRLKKLEMAHATARNVDDLGRPPASLADVTLGAMENRAQLLPVFSAFRTAPNLTRVELRYGCASVQHGMKCYSYGCDANDLAIALHGVVTLDISLLFPTIYIEASYPSGSSLRLELDHMCINDWHQAFLPMFAQHVDCFANLRALTIPIFALEAFASDSPALPALSEFVVIISEDIGTFSGGVSREFDELDRVYPWHLLRFLAKVTQRRVELKVKPFFQWKGPPLLPDEDDAQAVIDEITRMARPCEVKVLGFAPDTVPAVRDLIPGLDLLFVY